MDILLLLKDFHLLILIMSKIQMIISYLMIRQELKVHFYVISLMIDVLTIKKKNKMVQIIEYFLQKFILHKIIFSYVPSIILH